MEQILIKRILESDMNNALELIMDTFHKYEAPDYTEEGIEEFKKAIFDDEWIKQREFFGAYIENTLVGLIATREKSHIALFFVNGKYHRRGIGRQLFNYITERNTEKYFTVNSSPYAHEVYKHLGFEDTCDNIQEVNGLKFYPMKKMLK